MSDLPVVAVAGATGTLGKALVGALLDPQFRSKYKDVVVLSRNTKSPQIEEWVNQGAIAKEYNVDDDASVKEALAGVDVLVNVLASNDGGFKSKVAAVVTSPSSSIKLYIPSEFGVDHYLHDFQHPEWDKKAAHFEAVSARKDLKICRVFNGLFLEMSIGPWFGFNTKEGKYEVVGSGDAPVTFTGIQDIAKSIASAIANVPIDQLPDKLYISGDSTSLNQVAKLMTDAGAGNIETTNVDLAEYKTNTFAAKGLNPAAFLRFLMAEGNIDNEPLSNNELVNPGQKYWKWKTMKDYAGETKGRPWANL
ncbi:hypothetical protein ABW19_dt0209094 [Dactylella cylindrospora]|nr:hypothetical protein ABW19_dt0209094 [Dactylella cylindrospora]